MDAKIIGGNMHISSNYTQPLTAEELALAKAQRARNAGMRLLSADRGNCADEQAAAKEALEKAGGFGAFVATSTMPPSESGIIIKQNHEVGFVCVGSGKFYSLFREIPAPDGFGIPQQHSGIDPFHDNHLLLGRGSRIAPCDILDFWLEIDLMSREVRAFDRNNNVLENADVAPHINALKSLIFAIETSNERDSFVLEQNTVAFLERMGIDTSRNFWINGIGFGVEEGRLKVNNASLIPVEPAQRTTLQVPDSFRSMSHEDLNRLVERAYEQGLFDYPAQTLAVEA